MAALLGLLASHGEMGVLSAPSLDLMRSPQDGWAGVGQIGRGLNICGLAGVFPGFSPVGHAGVATACAPNCSLIRRRAWA